MNKQHAIKSVYLEITDLCNCYCPYCYNDSKMTGKQYLSENGMKKIIDSCKELRVPEISFSGGEPFLHPNLMHYIELVREEGIEPIIITNGSIEFEKFEDKLLKLLPFVRISFDTFNQEIFKRHRGVDVYKIAYNNIVWLNANYPEEKYSVRMNLDYDNRSILRKDLEQLREMGVKNVYLSLINSSGRGKQEKHLNIVDDRECIDEINLNRNSMTNTDFKVMFEAGIGVSCPYTREKNGDITLAINSRGEVFPCLMFEDTEFSLGNLEKETLADIVTGNSFLTFCGILDERKNKMKECSNCLVNRICGRGCPAKSFLNTGDINCADGLCNYRQESVREALKRGLAIDKRDGQRKESQSDYLP